MQTSRDVFSTVHSEGALLPPSLLRRIAEGDTGVGGLAPSDYHLVGEKINEAVNRAWNRALAAWQSFREASARLPESDVGTSVTRERWLLVLFNELGYGRLQTARALEVAGRSYPVSHLWHRTPMHLVGFRVDLDRRTAGVAGASRVSPHGIVQDLLNRSPEYMWGILSNGRKLRLLRDSVSLVRQAYIEFDVESMMEAHVFSDFVLLWLLCHQSRVEAEQPEDCWLERWTRVADEQGTRALDHLRDGVEAAIQALGQGFLQHKANRQLLERLRSGELSTQDYYRQLLRMVYRLIFLFVTEDRDFLFAPGAPEEAKTRYHEHYSTARVRALADRRRGSRHLDLWRGLRLVFGMLKDDAGCPALGLPALNSFLWSLEATADLVVSDIQNAHLLEAVRSLAFTVESGARRAVDFRNLGPEELGSVYESLLELHPEVNADAATFALATTSGNERKTTGSYYTPDALIQQLLDTVLDSVLERAAKAPDPESAILNLKVLDPACGSGHFLIAAAHRLAKRLASVRAGGDEPSPSAVRRALRDVIGRCIYGVDINPMAVELCKVSLWMDALEPGKPLSFLDHHVQVGNSLLGATPALVLQGVPDAAFGDIEGDDKGKAIAARKQNKKERERETLSLFGVGMAPWDDAHEVAQGIAAVSGVDDSEIAGIREKQRRYERVLQSDAFGRAKLVADAWTSAFLWRMQAGGVPPVLSEALHRIRRHPRALTLAQRDEIDRLASSYQFFHWHLAFPEVFSVATSNDEDAQRAGAGWSGGFDVVLGNPPWDNVEIDETTADSERVRVWRFQNYLSAAGRFPLTGRGRRNLFALFTEMMLGLLRPEGRGGIVVPSSLVTDKPTEALCRELITGERLVSLFDFENKGKWFPDVHRQYKFSLLTVVGEAGAAGSPTFGFFLDDVAETRVPGRTWQMSADDIAAMSPERFSVPAFSRANDADIATTAYRNGVTLSALRHHHGVDLQSGLVYNFDQKSKSVKFTVDEASNDVAWLRVFEGEYFNSFDHRFASYESGLVKRVAGDSRQDVSRKTRTAMVVSNANGARRWSQLCAGLPEWYVGLRRQARTTDALTSIAAILPQSVAEGSVSCFFGHDLSARRAAVLCASLNSFIFNYVVRLRQGGANLSKSIYEQIPLVQVLKPELEESFEPILDRVVAIVLQLTYSSDDVAPFARACGFNLQPFTWDESTRASLRAELEALQFLLYGLSRTQTDAVMEGLDGVRRRDEKEHGDYRTKRMILEWYDALADRVVDVINQSRARVP